MNPVAVHATDTPYFNIIPHCLLSTNGCYDTNCRSVLEMLVAPLQERMDDWKKVAVQLDKEHSKGKLRNDVKCGLSYHAFEEQPAVVSA